MPRGLARIGAAGMAVAALAALAFVLLMSASAPAVAFFAELNEGVSLRAAAVAGAIMSVVLLIVLPWWRATA